MKTIEEMAQMINDNVAQCAAFVEGDAIEVVVRAKKSDKVFIEDGIVTFTGKTSSKAYEIATLLDLEVEE